MKYKKIMLILIMAIFLASIASVCAPDANDTLVASEDTNQMDMSSNDEITEDNLKTSEENTTLTQANDAESDSQILSEGEGTYNDLREEIGSGGDKNLAKSYYRYTGGDTIEITTSGVINGNGAVIDMTGSNIRAFTVSTNGVTIKNLTIKNANCDGDGGAVHFNDFGTVTNCTFVDNKAAGDGGAIWISSGNVENCNFAGNNGTYNGGAVYFMYYATVTNCNFIDNKATDGNSYGGAVYFLNPGTVENCNFTNNQARNGGAIYSQEQYTTADTCIFKRNSGENVNTVIFPPTLIVDNFTTFYGLNKKLTFDLKTNSSIPVTNGNISISVYFKGNDSWVRNYSCLSGEGWIPDLPVGSYYAIFDTEYAGFQKINRTITVIMPADKYYVNVTSLTTSSKTVNITAKSNIPNEIIKGKLLFILPNGDEINANYAGNGIWWTEHTFDDYGDYQVNATYIGLDNVAISNATINITKNEDYYEFTVDAKVDYDSVDITVNLPIDVSAPVLIDVDGVGYYANVTEGTAKLHLDNLPKGGHDVVAKYLGDANYAEKTNATSFVVLNKTLRVQVIAQNVTSAENTSFIIGIIDEFDGNVLIKVEGKVIYNGRVKLLTVAGKLTEGYKTATIVFYGDERYDELILDNVKFNVQVIVKKAKAKIVAKKKTFKKSKKVKKYTVTLKDNTGKAIKMAKVTIKVGKKTFSAKTNSKGKAVFKLKKLTKKAKYTAKITYKGDKYYNKVTKKVKITIK